LTNTVIGFLRHGQTDWNIDFRLQGTTDIPLNQTGRDQARDVAGYINAADWDVLVTSPLSRAADTAAIVAGLALMPTAQVEPLLLERAFGVGEGLTYEEWSERFKGLDVIPGGETVVDLADRVNLLLETLLTKYRGKRVLAISHGALIRKVIEICSDYTLPLEGQRFKNASLSTIVHTDGAWGIKEFDPEQYRG